MKKILKNDYLVTWLIGIGVITLLIGIGIGFVYSFHKTTFDSELDVIAERNKQLAEIRKASFEECED